MFSLGFLSVQLTCWVTDWLASFASANFWRFAIIMASAGIISRPTWHRFAHIHVQNWLYKFVDFWIFQSDVNAWKFSVSTLVHTAVHDPNLLIKRRGFRGHKFHQRPTWIPWACSPCIHLGTKKGFSSQRSIVNCKEICCLQQESVFRKVSNLDLVLSLYGQILLLGQSPTYSSIIVCL